MVARFLIPALALLAAPLAAQPAPQDLSVMTYNVHGLPWPFAVHRRQALQSIGARLAQMRTEGDQPHLVLLQEAFTKDAKLIARDAGYPYAVTGPSREERLPLKANAAEQRFARSDDLLKGERDGTMEDSGLLVLSDYPVLGVERAPYSRFACAGYDCLANKGILLVRIAVPGMAEPLTVIDTHMNSRGAAGVGPVRADQAYARQAEELRLFVAANVAPGSPAILGGDFNTGRNSFRHTMVGGVLAGAPDAIRSALAGKADLPDRPFAQIIVDRGEDWLMARGSDRTKLALQKVTVPFGREPDGSSLSDHFGYVAHYAISPGAADPVTNRLPALAQKS